MNINETANSRVTSFVVLMGMVVNYPVNDIILLAMIRDFRP